MKNKHSSKNALQNQKNTYVTAPPPTNNEKSSHKKISIRLICTVVLTMSLAFSISINISFMVGVDFKQTDKIVSQNNNTTITSEDCYTKTVVHGSRNDNTDEKQPIIEVHTSLYEDIITNNLTYDENGVCIKTSTETPVKIADVTHLYYPNSAEYAETYEKYID